MKMKFVQVIGLTCVVIDIVLILVIIILRGILPPVVPLLYGLPVSGSEVLPSMFLVIPPVVAIVFAVINYFIVKLSKDVFLEKIFSGLIIAVTILSTIAVVNIILLVGKI